MTIGSDSPLNLVGLPDLNCRHSIVTTHFAFSTAAPGAERKGRNLAQGSRGFVGAPD